MSIKYYITPLIRYWWLLVAAALVAAVFSFLAVWQEPPIYQTRTTLVIGRAVYEANPTGNDIYLSQQLGSYYADIGIRQEVKDATMAALGLTRLPTYTVLPLPNSQLLEIVVTDSNPLRAQAVANELANQLINLSPTSSNKEDEARVKFINEQITYLETKIQDTLNEIDVAERKLADISSARQIADTQSAITALQAKLSQLQSNYASLVANTQQGAINSLSLIEPAVLPTTPIGPQKALTIALSALIATVIAAGAAYLLEFLDDTFKSIEDVTHVLGLTVIGQISEIPQPKADSQPSPTGKKSLSQILPQAKSLFVNRRLVSEAPPQRIEGVYVAANPRSLIAESFRSLRINLDFVGLNQSVRTILITSPEPSEGKTSVATNLAVVMAQGGRRVILIDADLRKPMVHQYFKISNQVGLSEVLMEQIHLHEAIRAMEEKNVSVITSGGLPPNPVDLLSSSKFSGLLEQLKQWTDIIIVDGPPMILPDSIAISTKVDGVLVIVRHGYTRKEYARLGIDQLKRVGAHVFGVVLNRIPRSGAHLYGQSAYYHYYDSDGKSGSSGVQQAS